MLNPNLFNTNIQDKLMRYLNFCFCLLKWKAKRVDAGFIILCVEVCEWQCMSLIWETQFPAKHPGDMCP